jgi:hypothetical protein
MGGRTVPYDEAYDFGDYYDDGYFYSDKPSPGEDPVALPDYIQVQAIVSHNASVAVVEYGDLSGFGDAKRNKGERKQDEVGRDLALGRAFIDLGNQLIERGFSRLDCEADK